MSKYPFATFTFLKVARVRVRNALRLKAKRSVSQVR